ncbi:unnamed protein product [Pseudo-nitzschia multistriata]|uniref:Uncharacterized protein n=1 Tax=Pseudo-nitzschia multistriata TaxID=183589 RepID=A0A448ZHJ0_9STRA|nr:unnamed protein product [Pseudo-nitzschia multistriata]
MKRLRVDEHSKKMGHCCPLLCLTESTKSTIASGVAMTMLSEKSTRTKLWSRRRSCSKLLPGPLRFDSCLCFAAFLLLAVGLVSFPTLPVAEAVPSGSSGGDIELLPDSGMTYFDAAGLQRWDSNPQRRRRARELQHFAVEGEHPHNGEHRQLEGGADNELGRPEISASPDYGCTVPDGKCTECTFSEQKTYDACKATGKWQKFECILVEGEGETRRTEQETPLADPAAPKHEMKSCKYTEFDEGFAMFELEVFCLLIGCLAFVSVRKQKRLSSSMFDRRKQQGPKARSRVGNGKRISDHIPGNGDEIEFTPMTNQEKERVPLIDIEAEHMDVI